MKREKEAKKMNGSRRILLVALSMTLILISFYSRPLSSAASSPAPTGELRIVVDTLMGEVLDPIRAITDCRPWLTLLYDSLVGIDPPSTRPSTKTGIAYKWEIAPNAKSFIFHLRKGIKFHNGDELTARDVKFSIERAMGPISTAGNVTTLRAFIEKIEAIDDYTVKVYTKEPFPLLPEQFSELIGNEAMIVPMKYIQTHGDDYFSTHPIGTGPYKFKDRVPGRMIEYEAAGNHWYWGVPKYKKIRFEIVPEPMARIGLLKRDEADITAIPRDKAREIERAGLRIVEKQGAGSPQLLFHDSFDPKYPMGDIRVRKALALSIDKKKIHETIFSGHGFVTANMLTTPLAMGYELIPPVPYDPVAAKDLLQEAGYGKGKPKGPLQIKLYSYSLTGFPEAPDVIESVAMAWREIGIDAKIIQTQYEMFRTLMFSKKTEGSVSTQFLGARIWPLPIARARYTEKGVISFWWSPESERLIKEAGSAIDLKEQERLMRDLEKLITAKYPGIALCVVPSVFGVNSKTIPEGWDLGAISHDWNLEWLISRPPWGKN